jgi:hypothetical protein
MFKHADRVAAYRQRAKELRTLVPGMRDEARRAASLKIADECDRLALEHEQFASPKP